jgi:regulator of replication initiation timing
MEKNQNINIIIIAAIFLVFIIMRNISLSNQVHTLQQNVNRLEQDMKEISEELDTIIEMNSIMADSQYAVEQIEENGKALGKVTIEIISNKLGYYTDLQLLYRTAYDCTKIEDYDYSKEEWKYVELNNNAGTYSSNFIVPFSCNYELKLAFKDNNQINYEQLPNLDLYTKAEHVFMKGINIYDVKKSKLEFDVQIAKFKSSTDTKLLNAICNVYYGEDIVKTIDILKENEVSDRKEPKRQIEHLDGDYWFVIDEVDFSSMDEFDQSKVEIEVVLEDSLGNTYKQSRGIDSFK